MKDKVSAENNTTLGEIVSHQEEQPGYFRMRIVAPQIAKQARAGQFVHVLPRASSSFDPLLRRAFSLLSIHENEIEILYRVQGRGTELLAQRRVGETLDVLGPLGREFAPLPRNAILVGGGVGVPPMAMLARQEFFAERIQGPTSLHALIGARSAADVLCVNDFASYEVPLEIATEDGSLGERGYVTSLLEKQLQNLLTAEDKTQTLVYSCGPLPMLKAVAEMCSRYGVMCQVSMEENMPCGVGVCNGCVVAVREHDDDYGCYRRVCIDGPVMWAHEIDWS